MVDPTEHAADADLDLRSERKRRGGRFIQVAPAPEPPDVRDRAGAQRGMALVLLAGGLFWAAVAVALYLVRG